MNTIKFYLPGFFTNFKLNTIFIDYFHENHNQFYENIEIGAVYDSFPNCIWNGGRYFNDIYQNPLSYDDIDKYFNAFYNRKIPCRLILTNNLLTEYDLCDEYANNIVDIFNNYGNKQIVLTSDLLKNSLREKYNNLVFISSTTKVIRNLQKLEQELAEDYFLVSLDISFNNTPSLFNMSNKDKCEILLNDTCYFNCEKRLEHYNFINKLNINQPDIQFNCPYAYLKQLSFYDLLEINKSHVKVTDLYNKYIDNNFYHFKISGRGFPDVELLEFYIYYMVKPEFKDIVRSRILKIYYGNF